MELLQELNKDQRQAVLSTEGPLLVVAGAGTGKTKVITHRIAYLISCGIDPSQILAVTFTNKAAEEMTNRVIRLAATSFTKNNRPYIGTFHALSVAILRKYGNYINIPPYFSILDEKENFEIIKSVIKELKLDPRQFQPPLIQNLISQKKSRFLKPDLRNCGGRASEDCFTKALNLIWKEYEERLKFKKALDFDDLVQKTLLLFEEHPQILKIYQEKWPYIHIDEYQDTDPIQARLVNILGQKNQNVCAVGDEDQSIYGFRGADFTNILNFEQIWPQNQTLILERNYRSTQKILDAANAVISKNRLRRPKNLFTEEKSGTELTAFAANNETEEAEFIAAEIKKMFQNNLSTAPIAILCRANFQFPVIEDALLRHGLPFEAASNQDSLLGAKQPIQLITIHAAKGLEFQYVFIPGLENSLLPYSRAIKSQSDEEKEEERRLFYVALTRGQEKIFLSWSRYRTVFGAKQINQPSPFLSDIPPSLIKWL